MTIQAEVKAIWTSEEEADTEYKTERHNIMIYDGNNKPYIKIISHDDDTFEVIEFKHDHEPPLCQGEQREEIKALKKKLMKMIKQLETAK